jgi:hypothetical protein
MTIHELAEIAVVRDQDPLLFARYGKNLRIR